MKLNAFAADNQLHVHCDLGNVLLSVNVLEQCVTAIGHCMSANRLKLNAEKTELMWAGTRYTIAIFLRLHDPTMTLGTDFVKAAGAVTAVRVLGVLFTPDLALDKHVTTVSAKCFFSSVNYVRSTVTLQLHVCDQSDRLWQRTARERAKNYD